MKNDLAVLVTRKFRSSAFVSFLLILLCGSLVSPAQMSVTIAGTTTFCQSGTTGFNAFVSNGSGTLSYQWKKNGVNVSSTQTGPPPSVLVYSPVANGDVFKCVVTSSSSGTATSNSLTVNVISPLSFSVVINTNSSSFCQGDNVIYTGTPNLPVGSYQWSINGATVSGATASTFTTTASSVSQLQSVSLVAATSYTCASNTSASSNASAIPFTITAPVAPSVTASANISGAFCLGTPIAFTATPVNGGSTPGYQWRINGSPVAGATGSTFTSGSLTNGQQVSVLMTSNAHCAVPATATSNGISVAVSPNVTIPATPSGPVLVGQGSTYTYTTSGGNATDYNWSISPGAAGTVSNTGVVSWSAIYAGPATITASSNGCNGPSAASAPLTVNFYPRLVAGMLTPAGGTITAGSNPGLLTVSTAMGGNVGGYYHYQWQSSADNIHWTNVVDTSQSYAPGNLTATTYYQVQVTRGPDIAYSNSVQIKVAVISTDVNYIRMRTLLRPGVTDTATASGLTDPSDVQQTTQYFDGLGRPVQTVVRQASPLGKDMVSVHVYDPFGRETTNYLPYVAPSADGNYKTNFLAEQANFNNGQFPGEQFYYGQTNFEASPLNRPLTTFTPGANWVGAGRGVSSQYLVNDGRDSIQLWNINPAAGSLPTRAGIYGPGLLYKNATTDEQGHQVVEYKDKEGHVVLKKVQLADSLGTAHTGWLCTYYVYDDLGNLRFVLPPRVVELINNGTTWAISQSIADELCFRYEYDQRNRMVIKKVPGAGEVWMVYDGRDRLVMDQDSVQRKTGKWMVIKYDSLNRQDSTVLLTDANNRVYHQNLAYNSSNYPAVSGTFVVLTRDFYDDYSWRPGVTSLPGTLVARYTSNSHYFITNYNTSPAYAVPLVQSPSVRGMRTGHLGAITGTAAGEGNLIGVYFYDDHGRMIQQISDNWANTRDTTTTQYDFSGKPLCTLFNHGNVHNGGHYHKILTKMNYDAGARLTSIWKNIDSAATDQRIDSMQYDELGQLKVKYLGNSLDSLVYDYNIRGWLAAINKNYLLQSAGAIPLHYFGMELGYDKTTAAVPTASYKGLQYNGNIAGTIWKSAGDGVNRQYDFSYDKVNRLTKADFNQQFPGGWGKTDPLNSSSVPMDFSTSNLTYDANGNIGSMTQKGFKLGGSATIDSLVYGYLSNSNKLNQVMDVANDATSVLGDFHYTGTKGSADYQYDGNGNLTQDANKGITSISYTYQNLPAAISFGSKGQIYYDYDAEGTRLRKRIYDNLSKHLTVHLYINGMDYRYIDTITGSGLAIDTLDYIPTEEGRARWAFHKYTNGTTGNGWEYDFFEKDHLGNTRVVLSQEKDTTQYMATMETAYRATENALFYNIDSTAYATSSVPGGYPTDNTTSPNSYVARVNGTGQKMGPAILLKVMSGDSVSFGVKSFYKSGGTVSSQNSSLQDVLNSLASGLMSVTGGAHGSISTVNTPGNPVYAALNSFLPTNDPPTTNKPKAYLNWMLLDNQFNYVSTSGQSGAQQVGTPDILNPLASTFKLKQSGYLYIWVSNETVGWDAFFDNLSVNTYTGPMLEENHYYPFGLTMAGISDKALKTNYVENRYKFGGKEMQNKEFSDGSGLEEYDFGARHYDPQIGRWHNLDPRADKLPQHSPFEYSINNPILFVDPDGKFPYPIHIRSFAPFATFGGGFAGDNRGWSTTLGAREVSGGVTSRMQQTFTVDPSQKSVTGLSTWSDPSHHPLFGTGTAADKYDVKAGFKSSGGDKTAVVTSQMAANLPLIPSADIDIHSAIRLTENIKNGTLNVLMSMDGDRFPAAEAFIGDSKGQQVFIGVSGYDGNPYTSLPGNNDRPMFYVNFDIKINDKGEFVSVVSAGQTYSISDWNKKVQSTPLEYQKSKSSGSSSQAGGCVGNGCGLLRPPSDDEMWKQMIDYDKASSGQR